MNARVLKVHNGKAEVQLICTDSEAGKGAHCGACTMGTKPASKPELILAENPVGAKPGDMVDCEIREHGELKAATILFIVPLAIFMVALGVTRSLGLEMWQSFLAGLGVLALTFLGLQLILRNKTYYYIAGIK